jgi:hypothetical protein
MRSLTFDEVFAMLVAVQLSSGDLARLREWLASLAPSYRRFAQEAGITHETVNGKVGERARGG